MTTSEHWLQYSSPLKCANDDGKTQRMEKLSIIKSKHKQKIAYLFPNHFAGRLLAEEPYF